MRSTVTVLALALSVSVSVGCAAKKETTAGPATPSQPAAIALAPQDDGIQTGGLHTSEAIVKACGLRRYAPPPMFEYDSATLAEQDRTVLAEVARCFSDGPLRGQAVSLVGRADPRGEGEYNMALGESRADSVRRYLRDLGVAPQKVQATSRGEIDATGKDEEGWAQDRRVDIELASR
jgi:peptidoglycan-associated lipoprotein